MSISGEELHLDLPQGLLGMLTKLFPGFERNLTQILHRKMSLCT